MLAQTLGQQIRLADRLQSVAHLWRGCWPIPAPPISMSPRCSNRSQHARITSGRPGPSHRRSARPRRRRALAHTATAAWSSTRFILPLGSRTGATAHTSSAGLLVVPSFAAARTAGHTRSAALAVGPEFAAAGTAAFVRSAGLVVTLHLARAWSQDHPGPDSAADHHGLADHGRWSALPPSSLLGRGTARPVVGRRAARIGDECKSRSRAARTS